MERRKGLSAWRIGLATIGSLIAFGLVLDVADRMLPGRDAREAERQRIRLAQNEARESREAARAVERQIRTAAREARAIERQAEAEAQQAEMARRDAIRDAVCRRTPGCFAAMHIADADRTCRAGLEELARFQFRWTNRLGERRFSQYELAGEAGSERLVFAGDRIELQNGFGVWQNHVYECLYNPQSDTGIALNMRPGRL